MESFPLTDLHFTDFQKQFEQFTEVQKQINKNLDYAESILYQYHKLELRNVNDLEEQLKRYRETDYRLITQTMESLHFTDFQEQFTKRQKQINKQLDYAESILHKIELGSVNDLDTVVPNENK